MKDLGNVNGDQDANDNDNDLIDTHRSFASSSALMEVVPLGVVPRGEDACSRVLGYEPLMTHVASFLVPHGAWSERSTLRGRFAAVDATFLGKELRNFCLVSKSFNRSVAIALKRAESVRFTGLRLRNWEWQRLLSRFTSQTADRRGVGLALTFQRCNSGVCVSTLQAALEGGDGQSGPGGDGGLSATDATRPRYVRALHVSKCFDFFEGIRSLRGVDGAREAATARNGGAGADLAGNRSLDLSRCESLFLCDQFKTGAVDFEMLSLLICKEGGISTAAATAADDNDDDDSRSASGVKGSAVRFCPRPFLSSSLRVLGLTNSFIKGSLTLERILAAFPKLEALFLGGATFGDVRAFIGLNPAAAAAADAVGSASSTIRADSDPPAPIGTFLRVLENNFCSSALTIDAAAAG